MKSAQANTKGQQKSPVVGVREKKDVAASVWSCKIHLWSLVRMNKSQTVSKTAKPEVPMILEGPANDKKEWHHAIPQHPPPSDYYINTSMVRWDHCCCFDCSAAFNQDNNVWFVCDEALINRLRSRCAPTQEVRMRKRCQSGSDFLSLTNALKSRWLCSLQPGHLEVTSTSPPHLPQDQIMPWCQVKIALLSCILFHSSSEHKFSSSTFSLLYQAAAGSDGIPITPRWLVLTSSLVVTTDYRLQSDCFQPPTGVKKCRTAAGCYSQKCVRQTRYSVSFGTRRRSVHSASRFPHT